MDRQQFPLVSVRIPVYNHELYIQQCLDSIYIDSYINKEIVIIDDGSTDSSKNIIEEWIQNHKDNIKVTFVARKNLGVTKTLNELNSLCSGEYIVGIASDDYLLKDSISKRIEYMQKYCCDVLFADCIVVNECNQVVYESALKDMYKVDVKKYVNQSSLQHEIINNWSIPGGTLIVHKSVYDMYKYDEKSIVEDYDFFLFVVSKKKLCYLDIKVAAYRIHGLNSHKLSSYFRRQFSILRALMRNFSNFSFRLQIDILRKIVWLSNKMIKNFIMRRKL